MIDPAWRTRLAGTAAALVAIWAGWLLAEEAYVLPALIGAGLAGMLLTRLTGLALDALVMAALIAGYFIGNRGFAQLMPVPGLPLLPAEIGLVIAGGWLLWTCTVTRRSPVTTDLLNYAVLLWLLIGTARLLPELRTHGLMAVRDYAMIYYAVFFFIAQNLARDPRTRRFLLGTLALIGVAQPLVKMLVDAFPEFFSSVLLVRGIPLILMKGDLALTFMAAGAVLLICGCPIPLRRWLWPWGSLALLHVLVGDNRASVLGALTALCALALSPLRRFVALQAGLVAVALLIVAGLAWLGNQAWSQQKLDQLTERIASIADAVGEGRTVSEEGAMKSDNNRFRRVWWQTVAEETWAQNPIFGLGFGYDLARGFLQTYNPDMAEDFTARSPHSFVVTAFGRTGLVGLAALVLLVGTITQRGWAALRRAESDPTTAGLWLTAYVILVSACFGVVLEGPMGAVVFWSILGLANFSPNDRSASNSATTEPLALTSHCSAR